MICRVQHIKSFGVLSDFQWPSCLPDFKRFNLIYGWNYSGKTTLSRVFRCFEQQQPHGDFATAQIQLKGSDGTIYSLTDPDTAPFFRVFNSDFVQENLRFDYGSAEPILVLGAEDIAKIERLKSKKAELHTLTLDRETNKKLKQEKTLSIERELTRYARDFIKNPIGVPNYDRSKFEPKVIECKVDPDMHLMDDDVLFQYLSIYRSTDKRPTLSLKKSSLSSIIGIKEKTSALLTKVVTANNPISRLKENPIVESWVKDGRALHEGKKTCQFCEQTLPSELLTRLTEHFSADYETMMEELSLLENKIKAAQKEEIKLDHKSDFYPELSERFVTEESHLGECLGIRKDTLGGLLEALMKKKTKVFTSLSCPVVVDPTDRIFAGIETINKIITEHNTRTEEFDKKRQDAFMKIQKHYAALFVREQNYNNQIQDIENFDKTIAKQGKQLKHLEDEIRHLETEISEASKGAERINELLLAYFSKDDLRIEVSSDKRFQIVRGNTIAKNLSEGEKTAIAFAYFITLVQNGRHPLDDTRVVIDDPISSLDGNHLFNTYSLIKTQLAGCRQFFISTHSFEFYNLIRDWVADDEGNKYHEKPQNKWKTWSVYLIIRNKIGQSKLQEIPKELLKFKSEYHYLFSTLYHFDKSDSNDFDCLLGLPNVVRRFMEAFGGIMIPKSTGLKKKMERLFPDEVERERVWKFINHYSHNTTIMRSLTIPDTSECTTVVKTCLKAIQDWNDTYFADLEAEIS